MPMQFAMPITTNRPNRNRKYKFQYGGRQFCKTGSSNNSAVDWNISSKFGMQIDLKQHLNLTDHRLIC